MPRATRPGRFGPSSILWSEPCSSPPPWPAATSASDGPTATALGGLAVFGAFWFIVGNGPIKDPSVLEPPFLMLWVMGTVIVTVFFWLSYLALEPSVRRRWPDTLVSWTRLLRGRVLDPLVGRDVLLGVLGGIAIATLAQASNLAGDTRWPASPTSSPEDGTRLPAGS